MWPDDLRERKVSSVPFASPELQEQLRAERRERAHTRYRVLLSKQRSRFARYLSVADVLESRIRNGGEAALADATHFERRLMEELTVLDRLIRLVETRLNRYDAEAGGMDESRADEIERLRWTNARAREHVIYQNERNRVLIEARLCELRDELSAETIESIEEALEQGRAASKMFVG